MFCSECGTELLEDSSFCHRCGANCGRGAHSAPVGHGTAAGSPLGPPQSLDGHLAQAPRQPTLAPYQARPAAAFGGTPVLEYAGFWARFGARVLDGLIILGIAIIPATIVGVITWAAIYPHDQAFVTEQEEGNAFAAAFWAGYGVWLVTWAVYSVIGWARGGTWGMRALRLSLVRMSTWDRPGFGPAMARLLVSIVSACILYLGFLWMLWNKNKQTWHDEAADTVVICRR